MGSELNKSVAKCSTHNINAGSHAQWVLINLWQVFSPRQRSFWSLNLVLCQPLPSHRPEKSGLVSRMWQYFFDVERVSKANSCRRSMYGLWINSFASQERNCWRVRQVSDSGTQTKWFQAKREFVSWWPANNQTAYVSNFSYAKRHYQAQSIPGGCGYCRRLHVLLCRNLQKHPRHKNLEKFLFAILSHNHKCPSTSARMWTLLRQKDGSSGHSKSHSSLSLSPWVDPPELCGALLQEHAWASTSFFWWQQSKKGPFRAKNAQIRCRESPLKLPFRAVV